MALHQITRVRQETRRRKLTVAGIETLGARMRRIEFSSADLHDFASFAPDDHVKIFFPLADPAPDAKPCMRDFTPRAFDTEKGTLIIDFALHDAGPATQWAAQASAGQTLEIGGPRGSAVVPDDFDFYLFVGDETALPAIGRWVSELRADVPVTTIAVVNEAADEQSFDSRAAIRSVWVHREHGADDAALLRAALAEIEFPAGDGFIWIAAEAAVARALRTYVVVERGHPKAWVKGAGYWKRGQADVHERIED